MLSFAPHHLVAPAARYVQSDPDTAVRNALHGLEVRLTQVVGRDVKSGLVGVDLATQAFKPDGGPLRNPHMDAGEAQGIFDLFRGAFGAVRNPVSHRHVHYTPDSAVEALALASMLHRHLDRVETWIDSARKLRALNSFTEALSNLGK